MLRPAPSAHRRCSEPPGRRTRRSASPTPSPGHAGRGRGRRVRRGGLRRGVPRGPTRRPIPARCEPASTRPLARSCATASRSTALGPPAQLPLPPRRRAGRRRPRARDRRVRGLGARGAHPHDRRGVRRRHRVVALVGVPPGREGDRLLILRGAASEAWSCGREVDTLGVRLHVLAQWTA